MKKTVVILVDDKKRDLPGSALIAHHLVERFGVRCELQPLESWRSCLAGLRPDYILFNHLTSSHLAEFSRRLREIGVLVGVLPNEGILYDREVLEYNAGKFHSSVHIDQYFCWNKIHQEALTKHIGGLAREIRVVGVPRFDFYFDPWDKAFPVEVDETRRPRVLVCTNFVFARFKELPQTEADKAFRPWKDRLSKYRNYWEAIEVNARSRERHFDYLTAILEKTNVFIDLKPHPREIPDIYMRWHQDLRPEHRERVRLLLRESIFEVMPQCDLEVSCETCTTPLEAWLLKKPTIELVFERYPLFFHEETARTNRLCDSPDTLPELIERSLREPAQADLQEARRLHLEKWCDSPSGNSSLLVAQAIAEALSNHRTPRWDLSLQDRKRGVKLGIVNFLGLPYGINLPKYLKGFFPGQTMDPGEAKFIWPSDVADWKARVKRLVADKGVM